MEGGINAVHFARLAGEFCGIDISEATLEECARQMKSAATNRIEEFWEAARQCGFIPKMITLLPKQPLVSDRNYAYFFLLKKGKE